MSDRNTDTTAVEARLAEGLLALADAPAPPSGVDAARARSQGLRSLRRRRISLGVTAAVVASAVAVGGVALADTTGSGPGKPVQPAAGTAPARYSGHDPLKQVVEFGWLPPGVRQGTIQDAEWDGQGFAWAGSTQIPGIAASVENPGQGFPTDTHPDPSDPPTHAVPGPLVNGRPSHWMVDQGGRTYRGGGYVLRWSLADGRGAEVRLAGAKLDWATGRATTLHVAEGLRFPARPEGTPLPYYVTGLPRGVHLMSVSFDQHMAGLGRPWRLSAAYTVGDPSHWWAVQGGEVDWQIAPHVPGSTLMGGDRCVTRDGLDLCVQAWGSTSDAVGGLDGMLKKITVLGLDPAHWTTDVNR